MNRYFILFSIVSLLCFSAFSVKGQTSQPSGMVFGITVDQLVKQLGLEGQVRDDFIDLFNKNEQENRELKNRESEAFNNLRGALTDKQGDIRNLLNAYLDAKEANTDHHILEFDKYDEILTDAQLAKFYYWIRAQRVMTSDSISITLDDEAPFIPL